MPSTIPYVTPDVSKTTFAIPATRYSFDRPSHVFTGQNATFMEPEIEGGNCFINAEFNYAGELKHGTVKVVGGVPSLSIPDHSILLQGSIINVDTIPPGPGDAFRVNFIFRITQDHPSLQYDSHIGVWNAYFLIPSWPSHWYRYLFRKTWGQDHAPLNSYIGQVSSIV